MHENDLRIVSYLTSDDAPYGGRLEADFVADAMRLSLAATRRSLTRLRKLGHVDVMKVRGASLWHSTTRCGPLCKHPVPPLVAPLPHVDHDADTSRRDAYDLDPVLEAAVANEPKELRDLIVEVRWNGWFTVATLVRWAQAPGCLEYARRASTTAELRRYVTREAGRTSPK